MVFHPEPASSGSPGGLSVWTPGVKQHLVWSDSADGRVVWYQEIIIVVAGVVPATPPLSARQSVHDYRDLLRRAPVPS
jgi:hypothetical protein